MNPGDKLNSVLHLGTICQPSAPRSPALLFGALNKTSNGMSSYRSTAFQRPVLFFPLLCRPDSPISTQDVWKVVRDHYEGTEFDLSVGLASGESTDAYPSWPRIAELAAQLPAH